MKRIFLTSFLIFSLFLVTTISENEAFAKTDHSKPIITTQGNIYEISNVPTTVSLFVSAVDDVDGQIRVHCDKSANFSVFKIGDTTVRCYSMDKAGNIARTSFVVTVGDHFVKIPNWLKQTTQLWVNNDISDREYADTIQFLISKNIVHIPFTNQGDVEADSEIPIWIKTNSQNWIDGNASTDEFSISLSWMIERGLVLA